MSDDKPQYDKYGRMNYDPKFHPNQNRPWMNSDQKYLIANYEKDGPETVSLALGRTIHTIMQRVAQLRKNGTMRPRPKGLPNQPRTSGKLK